MRTVHGVARWLRTGSGSCPRRGLPLGKPSPGRPWWAAAALLFAAWVALALAALATLGDLSECVAVAR